MMKKIVGKGSHGTVYALEIPSRQSGGPQGPQGSQGPNDKKVAIKCIDFVEHGIELSEPILMTILKHPNLNKAESVKIGANDIKIYQNLADYDLHTYIKTFKPNYSQMVLWANDIAQGLMFLHLNNIIHGDIKSQNILLFQSGVAKLTDFTLSHIMCDTSVLGGEDLDIDAFNHIKDDPLYRTLCTPTHRAPEIWCKRKYNEKIDVWSFGVLLYEMVYRECPFKVVNDDTEKMVKELCEFYHTRKPKILLSGVVSDEETLKQTALNCLAVSPKRRPNIADLLDSVVPGEKLVSICKYFPMRGYHLEHCPIHLEQTALTIYFQMPVYRSEIGREMLSIYIASKLCNDTWHQTTQLDLEKYRKEEIYVMRKLSFKLTV